jgi:predicted GNAT family N-acyltransferase
MERTDTMATQIRRADWDTEQSELGRIREQVFVVAMNVPKDIECDGQDAHAYHYVATDARGRAVGTARLLPTGQIGRMAVLEGFREQGIGHCLLAAAVEHAGELGLRRVFLHAQIQTLGFYEKAGFRAISDEFLEAGIAHREMELVLAVPFEPVPKHRGLAVRRPEEATGSATDVPATAEHFDTESSAADLLARVLAPARRNVEIFSPLLDHALYECPDVVDALSGLARRAPAAQIRVLIAASSAIVARGHALIRLMQRLPSKITLRRIDDGRAIDTNRSFAVVDGRAVWILPDSSVYHGWANLNDRVQARRLLESFETAFAQAREDPELRRLAI